MALAVKGGKLKVSEADVALACVEFLTAEGWNVHRLTADRHAELHHKRHEKVDRGTPDYLAIRWARQSAHLGCMDGFYLEVKRPGGKLRKSQQLWIAANRLYPVCVAASLDELKEWYDTIL